MDHSSRTHLSSCSRILWDGAVCSKQHWSNTSLPEWPPLLYDLLTDEAQLLRHAFFVLFCFYTGGESKMSPECALYKPSCHTLLTTRQNKALEHVLCAHIWFKKTWNDHASTFYTLCFSVLYYNIYYCIDCILFYKWGPCGGTVSFGFRIMSRVSGWLRLRCLSRAMELLLWLCNVRNRLSMLLQIMKLVQFIMK